MIAEVGGAESPSHGSAQRNPDAFPVAGIAPVAGWTLCEYPEWDSDGFTTPGYVARSATRDALLNVSRFRFSPSQERFAWLVRNDFPAPPRFGQWDDTDIEAALAAEQVAA